MIVTETTVGDGSCCCGDGNPPPPVPCCGFCPEVPVEWELEVTGVGNGQCPVCANYNGTFRLQMTGRCIWVACQLRELCTGFFSDTHLVKPWILRSLGPGDASWEAIPNAPTFGPPAYRLSAKQWNCNGPNVLPIVEQPSSPICSIWPNSVTVRPAAPLRNSCLPCYPCGEIIPRQWRLEPMGVTGGEPCESLNRGFIVDLTEFSPCEWSGNSGPFDEDFINVSLGPEAIFFQGGVGDRCRWSIVIKYHQITPFGTFSVGY